MSRVTVVVGGQYGSEAKGAIAGEIAKRSEPEHLVVGVRVGGPNAGHTVYGECPKNCVSVHADGSAPQGQHPWRLRQVPVAAVTAPESQLIIAQGSEVDPPVLTSEVEELDSAGYRVSGRLFVDNEATIITKKHQQAEGEGTLWDRTGSTKKGVGAARAGRIWRSAETVGSKYRFGLPIPPTNTALRLRAALHDPLTHVVLEGTQGFGLGLHAGHYPQTTSGDCRAIDFLAQAGISPWQPGVELDVVVVARTLPIRVAGNSGPLADETTWKALRLEPELTTVTKKVRRVGKWDDMLVRKAIVANGGPAPNVALALMMADYLVPLSKGSTGEYGQAWLPSLKRLVEEVETSVLRLAEVRWIGTSPVTVWGPDEVAELRMTGNYRKVLG